MKKYLSMLAVVAVAASAFAQGTVNFSNNGSTLVMDETTAAAVPNAGGFVQLLWAPSGTAAGGYTGGQTLASWLTANPGWSAIDSSIKAIGPVAGRFLGGPVTVPTATPGAAIQAAVASWTGNFSSFDAAVNAGDQRSGISSSFAVTTGNPTVTPPGTAAVITGAGQFSGLTVVPVVPEPSTLAFAGLGAAALLIFRRRK
jgi:hypothetical protein